MALTPQALQLETDRRVLARWSVCLTSTRITSHAMGGRQAHLVGKHHHQNFTITEMFMFFSFFL